MQLLRGAIVLIVLAGIALGVTLLLRPGQRPLPTGSSTSYQPAGAQGLYRWTQALGGQTSRLESRPVAPQGLGTLFVLEPATPFSPEEVLNVNQALEAGATVVVAADLPGAASILLARWEVELVPSRSIFDARRVDTGAVVPWSSQATVHTDRVDRVRLLATSARDEDLVVAVPVGRGRVIVSAAVGPFTNQGLGSSETAAWVYDLVVQPSVRSGGMVGFDESHYALFQSGNDMVPGLREVVLASPIGRGILLAVALTFVYLLLDGRRLGPPLPPAAPDRATRTMEEHVRSIAGLYRRARQHSVARAHFARHYRRIVIRALGIPADIDRPLGTEELLEHGLQPARAARLGRVLGDLDRAVDDRQLVAAVGAAEAAMADLPRAAARGTLSVPNTA